MNKPIFFVLTSIFLLLIAVGLVLLFVGSGARPQEFDGQRALADVAYQMSLGPRVAGTQAHEAAIDWMLDSLQAAGWQVGIQQSEVLGHSIQNVVAKRGSGTPWIILGAHYDSRMLADQDADPVLAQQPVPGANDGASGVAVLLELARVIPDNYSGTVWIVMFDAEDNGGFQGWDWILGSRGFAASLESAPDAVIVVDMIGDADLQIYEERNSDQVLRKSIWDAASALGYGDLFIAEIKFSMLDDHTPFLERGIPAVDIIDFDYPYWHTSEDTLDKISASSLQAVGDTVLAWLLSR